MAHEIEAKFRVADHQAVRRALRSAGAEYLATVDQMDTYYDTPEGMLLGRDVGLRIRATRCLRRGPKPVETRPLLTAKGPRIAGRSAKVRQEVQVHLDDAAAVEEILAAAGLKPQVVVEKRRASYRLGRCRVELDELPAVGCFVEIEAPSPKAIARTAESLGLRGEPITDHYVALLLKATRAGS